MPKNKITHEEYCEKLKETNISLVPIESYKGYMTRIKHYCQKCEQTLSLIPRSILRNPKCPCCENTMLIKGVNDIKTLEPFLASCLLNQDDCDKYKPWSNKKTDWICPNCKNIVRNKRISDVVRYKKVPCTLCNDGVSVPMKMTTYVVSHCVDNYQTECVFDNWEFVLDDKTITPRYDIVFDKYIIEVDGGFHYKNNSFSNTSVNVQKHIDNQKDLLASKNGYTMIRIDARTSDFTYVKNSIINSLSSIFDLSKINWDECIKYSVSSNIKLVCDYKNSHPNKTPKEIAEDVHIPYGTVMDYLKTGVSIGICIYDSEYEKSKNMVRNNHNKRKVVCLNTNEIFESLNEAIRWCGLSTTTSISDVCKGKSYSAGKHPNTLEKLHWTYYEDYLVSTN